MPRRRGCGKIGEEITLARVLGRGKSHSLLAACNSDGMVHPACTLYETDKCGMNTERFLAWVKAALVPQLGQWQLREKNSIVVYVALVHGHLRAAGATPNARAACLHELSPHLQI